VRERRPARDSDGSIRIESQIRIDPSDPWLVGSPFPAVSRAESLPEALRGFTEVTVV
jgi:hypothetical protein